VTAKVVKIGGAALADAGWMTSFAAAAAAAGEPMVIVHGGGPDISALSERLGLETSWHEGRRITSTATLDVAAMVLNGRVNKSVVAALVNAGVDAIGISGVDGALLRAELAENGALGRVGRIAIVRTDMLRALLALGHTVVVSPISLGEDGAPLNVNADDAAAAVAAAMGAAELVFLTDVPGVRDESGVCADLDTERATELVRCGVASGGMGVKLGAGVKALRAGVQAVRIGDARVLFDEAAGTVLHPVYAGAA